MIFYPMSYIAAHIITYINVYIYAQSIRYLYIIYYIQKSPGSFGAKSPNLLPGDRYYNIIGT